MKQFYITTPIYYVNDKPHIGHAYTTVIADIFARFHRINGNNVKFLTGTDEHGQKVQKSAEKNGLTPKQFVDQMSEPFLNLLPKFNIANDDFIRTTEDRHKKAAQHFWQKLEKNGHIYKDKYSGWYSVRDEAFYAESELTAEGLAPTGAPVEWVEEESYFFNLSKWQDKLLEYYASHPEFIKPESRRNEVISFVRSGLHDLSISRTTMDWGIEVPGDSKHVMYVWLDALTNYISALGYPEQTQDMQDFWPASVHLVGKDILRFHTVYWPAFLMAADLPLPKTVFAHGWWTNEGQKISKSLGNVIDPVPLVEEFGCDYVRYYMAREIILGNDGNFSRETFKNRINSELANKVGNLAQRTLSFIYKNCNAKIPDSSNIASILEKNQLITSAYELKESALKDMDNQHLNSYIESIIKLAEDANSYIDKEAPWKLKDNPPKMNEILYALAETIRVLAIYLLPIIPTLAEKMLDQLCVNKTDRIFSNISSSHALNPGTIIEQPEPIFRRLD